MRSFTAFTIALASITQLLAEQRSDRILIQGDPAGTQTIHTDTTGLTHVEYSYNDRGRGDHIIATWKLDAAGVPVEYEGRGNDYMKAPVEETFTLKNGKAHWKNRSEQGEQSVTGEAFYDGDPTQDIRDINKVRTVIKGGKVYDPAAIEKALGITAR
jgi:hypothetical protein